MNPKKLSKLESLYQEAFLFLQAEINSMVANKVKYREISKATGLDLHQINRLINGSGNIKFLTLIKACRKLMEGTKTDDKL